MSKFYPLFVMQMATKLPGRDFVWCLRQWERTLWSLPFSEEKELSTQLRMTLLMCEKEWISCQLALGWPHSFRKKTQKATGRYWCSEVHTGWWQALKDLEHVTGPQLSQGSWGQGGRAKHNGRERQVLPSGVSPYHEDRFDFKPP